MKTLLVVMGGLLLALCGLIAWLVWPATDGVWRVEVQLPVVGRVGVRVEPLLRFATTQPGRLLLDGTHWRTSHGTIAMSDQGGMLRLRCASCTFSFPALSSAPLQFDALTLSVRRREDRLSGMLEMKSAATPIRFQFAGRLEPRGVTLDWSLPRTAVAELLPPLRPISPVLRRAQVYGTLAATGTLHWPSRRWSAAPQLDGFEVTGLGTEALRYRAFTYRCPEADGTWRAVQGGDGAAGWVASRHMGRWLPRAVLIAEDGAFRYHSGYDLQALAPLLTADDRDRQRGASTLTQQLAKNFFTGGERSWLRKLEELLYAVEMERTLGKHRILALYLNTAHWGPGICGAGAAAQAYFARPPSQLNPAEAAWLAGILRNPHHAWQHEFLSGEPDRQRLEWVLRYMPGRVRTYPPLLRFATPNRGSD